MTEQLTNALMIDAYIGLGSNLNNPHEQVLSALEQLNQIYASHVYSFSSLYLSRPMGPADQPSYVNAVAWLKTKLHAHTLLKALQSIENTHGRTRNGEHWGPRTLDLDILVYGDYQLNSQALTVPHPGIKYREFVLYPLHEVNKKPHHSTLRSNTPAKASVLCKWIDQTTIIRCKPYYQTTLLSKDL